MPDYKYCIRKRASGGYDLEVKRGERVVYNYYAMTKWGAKSLAKGKIRQLKLDDITEATKWECFDV